MPIVPDLYKATFFVNWDRGGFSFSHYKVSTGHFAVMAKAQLLIDKYLACCGTFVEAPYIRVSKEGILGDSIVDTQFRGTIRGAGLGPPGSLPLIKPAINDKPDPWWTSALLRLGASATIYGHQFVRGIPDQAVTTPTRTFNDLNFQGALSAYMLELKAGAWGMLAVPRSANNQVRIQFFTTAQNGDVTITTDGDHFINQGDDFRLSRFNRPPLKGNPNGVWVADAVPTANTITVLAYQHMSIPTLFNRAGKVWNLSKQFFEYDPLYCKLVRVTRRKAGRPSDSLVGKLKTKP